MPQVQCRTSWGTPDFSSFVARASRSRANPALLARAGLHLVDGALRIRRGGDGLYDEVQRPITKPAEAVGAWLRSMENEIGSGDFYRTAELREAVIAAGEEVDAAVKTVPAAERLRGALYSDAIDVLGGSTLPSPTNFWPWIITAVLSGALVGVLITRRR